MTNLSDAMVVLREIPQKVWEGLANGSYSEWGGVVRDRLGRIVCHIVMPSQAEQSSEQLKNLENTLADQFKSTTGRLDQLAMLSQIGMGLQVANLAVSVASFVILYRRLGKLMEIANSIEAKVDKTNATLAAFGHGKLQGALDNLRHAFGADEVARVHFLADAKTTFGEMAASCEKALASATSVEDMRALEEGMSIAMIGHSLALSELGMGKVARQDFEMHRAAWLSASRAIAKAMLREDPQRLLASRHIAGMPTLDLIALLDFANDTTKGVLWLDELRSLPLEPPKGLFKKAQEEDEGALGFARHLVKRNASFEGCLAHFKFLDEHQVRASAFEDFVLSDAGVVGDAPAAVLCVMPREPRADLAVAPGSGFWLWLRRLFGAQQSRVKQSA